MKKILLTGLFAFGALTAQAQLADGSQAPDFTVTDINGNTHTLSEYLAQGKTVIIDVSATWCGPCWGYHGTHALADIYEAYGPDGSNEVVVLFVEGDPGTSVESIYGTNTPQDVSTTQGDWTQNSPYPIIDSSLIRDLYQVAFYPTVFRICPNGISTQMTQPTAAQLKAAINSNCGGLEGAQNYAKLSAEDNQYCGTEGAYTAQFKNFGVNAITTATAVLKADGTVVATEEFTGNVAQFGPAATVSFDAVTLNGDADYTVELTQVNGAAPFNDEFAVVDDITLTPEAAVDSYNNIKVLVYTDNYPTEIGWRIVDTNGTTVAGFSDYAGSANGGGADANKTKTHFVTLPEGIECYNVEMLDDYGDGWTLGNTRHGMDIFSNNELIFTQEDGMIDGGKMFNAVLKTTGLLNSKSVQAAKFAVYPNPTTGVLNFTTQEAVDVTVIDVTGKVVFTAKGINNGGSVNLSGLQKGMYIAKVKGATAEVNQKIILN